MAIASRLREMRLRAGLSQAEVARRLNVSNKAVSHWENGNTRPPYEALLQMAELYGTSAAYLLGETDDPRPRQGGQHAGQEVSQEDEEEMLRQMVLRLGGTQEDAEKFVQYLRLRRQIEGGPAS